MRISSNLFFQSGLKALNAQQADLHHIFQQLGSGKRVITPADDPLAAAQSVNIGQAQALNERYKANRHIARQNLDAEENVLKSVVHVLQDIKGRLIEAGNGVLSDADRHTLSDTLKDAKTGLLALANARDGSGQYLFSGHQQVESSPFDAQGKWNSALSGTRLIQVDQMRQLAVSDLGADIFARATPGSRQYLTAADVNNTGTGEIASPTVTDPNGKNIGKSFEIQFTSPGQYNVLVGGMVVSADQAYDPAQPTLSLPGGVSINLKGQPQAGDRFTIRPATSLNTTEMNVFASLDAIAQALNADTYDSSNPVAVAGLHNAITTALQRFDVHYDNVSAVQSSIGTRGQELTAIDDSGMNTNLSYSQQLKQLEDLDYYEATAQFQLRTAALEAATLAFRKIQSASYMNLHS